MMPALLTWIETYASLAKLNVAKKTKILLQVHVDPIVGNQFRKLARSTGRTNAGYLRRLVELHVRAIRSPRLAKALMKSAFLKSDLA